jgi:hypothetical protein
MAVFEGVWAAPTVCDKGRATAPECVWGRLGWAGITAVFGDVRAAPTAWGMGRASALACAWGGRGWVGMTAVFEGVRVAPTAWDRGRAVALACTWRGGLVGQHGSVRGCQGRADGVGQGEGGPAGVLCQLQVLEPGRELLV